MIFKLQVEIAKETNTGICSDGG